MSCSKCGAKRGHMKGCDAEKGAYRKSQKGKMSPREESQTVWIDVTCPTCRGSGTRGMRKCGLCNGKRTIKVPDE